jgi:hypothetical protein
LVLRRINTIKVIWHQIRIDDFGLPLVLQP